MRAYQKVPADPERKARLAEMRAAGHAWGKNEAHKAILAIGNDVTREQADRWIGRVLVERAAALSAIGADDQDISAWKTSCWKNFFGRLSRVLA